MLIQILISCIIIRYIVIVSLFRKDGSNHSLPESVTERASIGAARCNDCPFVLSTVRLAPVKLHQHCLTLGRATAQINPAVIWKYVIREDTRWITGRAARAKG